MNLITDFHSPHRLSNERLAKLVLESAADFAILTTGLDGVITSWNSAAERTMGWSTIEAVGRKARMIFTPEDEAVGASMKEMATALANGRATDERWHLRKDGTRFWGSGSLTRLEDDETGEHLGYAKIVRDRTQQHEAGERLKTSEMLLRQVFENNADCVTLLTPEGKLTFMNRTGLQILEVDGLENIRGREWASLWPEEAQENVDEAIAEAIAGRVGRFREFCPTSSGTLKWWDVQVTSVPGIYNKPEFLMASWRDVTEHQIAQDMLRRSEERLRAALDIQTVGVLFWGPDFRLSDINDAFVQMTGFSHDEAIGKTWQELTPPEFYPASLLAVEQVITLGEATPYEKEYYRKDGSRWWGLFSPRQLKGEVVEFVLDITDRKAAEAALRELNASLEAQVEERTQELLVSREQLHQSQKMEAVGQLTGGLAHDFNNMLMGISGSLELLQARVTQGRIGSLTRYITIARGAAERAAALTQRLLTFSRRQALNPKPTDINRLIEGLKDLIGRTVGPTITLEVVTAHGLPSALVDPNQLENALLNLCINARDAMPDGGTLTVETSCEHVDELMARDLDVAPAEYITLSVADNGIGMPPAIVARAFEPFFTTKPVGKGTGLGLSMIYGFVRQSGGQVHIHSEPMGGTTVCLYLPSHAGEATQAEPELELANAPQAQQGETVLVVDDEPTVRTLVAEVLEDLGYTVIEAGDSAAGLHILRSDIRIDLLVSDVGLPGGMNGQQMARTGRVLRPDLKVLFITGYSENETLRQDHLEPGMDFMIKPFAMEMLATRIKTMIAT